MTVPAQLEQPSLPIDKEYLCSQAPDAHSDPEGYYLERGLTDRLNPTRYFTTDWYAWQNPDWANTHAAPYLHYLETGRLEGRDPSPFVDIHQYKHFTGSAVATEDIYDRLLAGEYSSAHGVYDTAADLVDRQESFLGAIAPFAHRWNVAQAPKPALLVLQCGRSSLADQWFQEYGREFDVLVNYYDSVGFQPDFGDYVFFQKGTKFSAMWLFWSRYRDILQRYQHVLFLDDDILTSVGDLNRLFAVCRSEELDLAQMTLTQDSSCNWAELYSRPGSQGPRPVSTVEIMMPVLSAKALGTVAPTFGKSISGFGLDLVWGKLVADAGGKIAVIDDIAATHARPVDQAGGAYYSYLRSQGINAKAELWTLVIEYGASVDLVSH